MKLTFIYLPLPENILTNEEWQVVERLLLDNSAAEPVIPGTGGVRKLRVAFAHRGKSGSARTAYVHVASKEKIYFLLAYAKNMQENLTSQQKQAIRALVNVLKQERTGRI